MKWFKVSGRIEIHKPFIKKINIDGRKLCLVGYEGQIFAVSAKCPHAGEDLSKGWCTEGKLVCPVHRFSYNLTTGKGSPGQNDYVDTYAVKIEDNDVYIGFETFKERFRKMFE
jgi:nitrite reductase/ring-hydroxylating ferredoxin subunit